MECTYAAVRLGPLSAEQLADPAQVLGEVAMQEASETSVDGRILTVEFYEANYGLSELVETLGLVGRLMEQGIEFSMWDDGRYEFDGESLEWRRGMEKPWRGSRLNNAGNVIGDSEFKWLCEKHGADLPALVEAVRERLGLHLPALRGAAKEEAA